MARSIVLRFEATCFDCGRSLPAGSTARWFGKGRVSCCGNPQTRPGDYSPAAMPSDPARPVHLGKAGSRFDFDLADDTQRALNNTRSVPAPHFGSLDSDAELARAVLTGLSPAQLARLATVAPLQRLCVRLQSGARLVVAARDAQHVVACIEESLRDKVRDIMGAAS